MGKQEGVRQDWQGELHEVTRTQLAEELPDVYTSVEQASGRVHAYPTTRHSYTIANMWLPAAMLGKQEAPTHPNRPCCKCQHRRLQRKECI